MSKELLGIIASYLSQWDYADFSICNRKLYLSCNTPNLLQTLYLYSLNSCVEIKLKLYS